ncbi:sigma-70 family RNA polymerase sigma factor [Paenibacillus lautus]|uniref:RNA polymerase sigma factor n=1 Tax=Paenibacillus lautus TaxID=1401 RepID=UPI0020407D0D|nr:sigma-70 family RNA polymerase sigma factor [Paenibacillus lautus]MCM3257378.1 sigma-70 family RNA polymerase sigma factor [Paenibacillus lautus]
MDSIEEYVRRVKAGEVDCFEPIVEAYKKQIYIYCCRMLGCKQDAQDAVQDIFIKAFTKLNTYEAKVSFSSWLYKIAYHHCLNILRKRRVRMRVSRLVKPAGYSDSVEETLERKWFSEPLEYAMTKLSVEERNLLVLRVFEDKPFTEIAQILDKNLSAVKKKYARMKLKVIQLIQEKEGTGLCEIRDSRSKIEF